ncbi:MAG: FAD-dependent oxidoreductase [Thaumarchaeota archaeon]|nr:FAD-dependent oxidoreductase [Nitrososphaerota archaeon]
MVGAGPGGSAASLSLARKGANVLMLEKSKIPGERNMTGGVLYGDYDGQWGFINLMPDFEVTAPLQRRITTNEVVVLDRPDMKKGTSRYYRLSNTSLPARVGMFYLDFDTGHDYSVLRRHFDRWFANQAVQAGAMLSTETTVESLIMEGGAVVGVRTTKEDLRAKMVVDSSGVTSKLVEQAGLRGGLVPRQLYHGIKKVYRLGESEVEKRFRTKPGLGKALFFLGDFMQGVGGGAFIYTNRDTLSVGLVVSLDSLIRATTERFDRVGKLLDLQDQFEAHPMVAELLEGAQCLEYSAHNIPKGYKTILKKPYADGFLVTGDALGAFVKIGPMIDGMRRAISSGMMAARTFFEASGSGSFRGKNLSRYRDLLNPVYEDVGRSGRDGFFSESSIVYNTIPRLIFGTRFMSRTYRFKPNPPGPEAKDSIQRVQEGTSTLDYDEDEAYSHIAVDQALASKSLTKPWVPTCPVNCYTILTPKGVFASYRDLFEHNLSSLKAGEGGRERNRAFSQTLKDVAAGELRFDHVACVACGTCGAIGPGTMVDFGHEKDGHGVRYKFG